MTANVTVSVGRAAQRAHRPGARGVPTAAAATLENLGALVLGDHPLYLQQQVVLRRSPNGPIQKHQFGSGPAKLLDQQNLIGVAARQPAGLASPEMVEIRSGSPV
jgi:hypothetical protein